MKKIRLLTTFFITICISSLAQTHSYFSAVSLDCILLLEKKIDNNFYPHGTGFLVFDYSEKSSYYIVTCEHVLRNQEIYVCIPVDTGFVRVMKENKLSVININGQNWTLSGNKLRLQYKLVPNKTFITDKELDIGIFSIDFTNSLSSIKDTIELKIAQTKGVPKSMIKFQKDIPLGTDVFFTGFPLSIGTEFGFNIGGLPTGLFAEDIPNPLVRKGSIAWKSDNYSEFLLDAFSYAGNSGSPIFTINDIQNKSYLIGMVLGHLPSEKSENVGLARCIWMDKIVNLIEKYNAIR